MPAILSAARLEACRANGKKGGRPPGSRDKKVLLLEAAKRQFDQAVAAKALELLELQLRVARLAEQSPSASTSACDSLLDRAFGRPTPREETDQVSRVPVTIVNVFAEGTAPSQPAKPPDVLVLPARRSE